MLAPRRPPGAELRAHGEPHLCAATGHEGQLGRLVEQLVEADADEVEVHDLDDGAHAGHRRADAEADDRRLRDRCIADALTEALAEATVRPNTFPPAPTSIPARNTRSSRSSDSSSAARTASMVRKSGAPSRGAGGSAVAGLGRTTKSLSVSAPGGARRRAAATASSRSRATDVSTDAIASLCTPESRSRRAWTTRGSRSSHSRTSSAERYRCGSP